MDHLSNTLGPKEGYICVCIYVFMKIRSVNSEWNGKRETSTNKNTSENQIMPLNAGARVPLSLRVCLGHVPRGKIQMCR